MKITLTETFSKQALALERQLWQANPTDQKTLLALHSGSVSGVNVPGGIQQEKAAKEKEEKETTYNLMLEMLEAAYERFSQTMEEVKNRIAETRQYFQKKLDDLDQDEAAFKKDTILLQQGLEVYPDANDPRHYFYQDETGGWKELQHETYLEQVRDIHRQKGAVHTMQNKQKFDQYKDGVRAAPNFLNEKEARLNEIEQRVNNGDMATVEGREEIKTVDKEILEYQGLQNDLRNSAFGEKAELMEAEKSFLKNEFRQSADQKEVPTALDSDLLEDYGEPNASLAPTSPTFR